MQGPTSRYWIGYAFLSCACFTCFNYLTGMYNPDVLSGKVVNSLVVGIAAIFFESYKHYKNKREAEKAEVFDGEKVRHSQFMTTEHSHHPIEEEMSQDSELFHTLGKINGDEQDRINGPDVESTKKATTMVGTSKPPRQRNEKVIIMD